MIRKHWSAGIILASVALFASSPAALFAQGDGKWFVLRNHEVGNCWTAALVRIDGQYTSTFEQRPVVPTIPRLKPPTGKGPWRTTARATATERLQPP